VGAVSAKGSLAALLVLLLVLPGSGGDLLAAILENDHTDRVATRPEEFPYHRYSGHAWNPEVLKWEMMPLVVDGLAYIEGIHEELGRLQEVGAAGSPLLLEARGALRWDPQAPPGVDELHSLYGADFHWSYEDGREARIPLLLAAAGGCRAMLEQREEHLRAFDAFLPRMIASREDLSLLGLKYLAYAEWWWVKLAEEDRSRLAGEPLGHDACAATAALAADVELLQRLLEVASPFRGSANLTLLGEAGQPVVEAARREASLVRDGAYGAEAAPLAILAGEVFPQRMDRLWALGLVEGAVEYAHDVRAYADAADAVERRWLPDRDARWRVFYRAMTGSDDSIPVRRAVADAFRHMGFLQDKAAENLTGEDRVAFLLGHSIAEGVPRQERETTALFGTPFNDETTGVRQPITDTPCDKPHIVRDEAGNIIGEDWCGEPAGAP